MTVGLKGLFTPPAPETRCVAYLEVVHNGNTYDWMVYVPQETSVADFLASMETRIYAEIDYKEAQWAALEPKTKTISKKVIFPVCGVRFYGPNPRKKVLD